MLTWSLSHKRKCERKKKDVDANHVRKMRQTKRTLVAACNEKTTLHPRLHSNIVRVVVERSSCASGSRIVCDTREASEALRLPHLQTRKGVRKKKKKTHRDSTSKKEIKTAKSKWLRPERKTLACSRMRVQPTMIAEVASAMQCRYVIALTRRARERERRRRRR